MKVAQIQLCLGLVCSLFLFLGCSGEEQTQTPDAQPVVQDSPMETPPDEDMIPMQ